MLIDRAAELTWRVRGNVNQSTYHNLEYRLEMINVTSVHSVNNCSSSSLKKVSEFLNRLYTVLNQLRALQPLISCRPAPPPLILRQPRGEPPSAPSRPTPTNTFSARRNKSLARNKAHQ